MKLEQIYESYYVNPLVAINSTSAAELLEAFEQAAIECAYIREVLASLKNDQLPVNESQLTEDQKIFFVGAIKLVNSYKESTDEQFKARFESLLEAAPAAAPAAGGKPGWWSKIKDFLLNVGGTLGALGKGFLQGFAGSEGKDKTGRDRPGWKNVKSGTDLSKVSNKDTIFTSDNLRDIGVDQNTLNNLEKGNITGINVTDPNDNLVEIKFVNGRYVGKKVPSYQAAAQAGKDSSKTGKASTTAGTTTPSAASSADSTSTVTGKPTDKPSASIVSTIPDTPKTAVSPSTLEVVPTSGNLRNIRSRKNRPLINVTPRRLRESFNKTAYILLKDFHKTN
jgi:hypothetical protein